MKKLLLTLVLASLTVNANTFQDIEISNQLLAAGEYGQKISLVGRRIKRN